MTSPRRPTPPPAKDPTQPAQPSAAEELERGRPKSRGLAQPGDPDGQRLAHLVEQIAADLGSPDMESSGKRGPSTPGRGSGAREEPPEDLPMPKTRTQARAEGGGEGLEPRADSTNVSPVPGVIQQGREESLEARAESPEESSALEVEEQAGSEGSSGGRGSEPPEERPPSASPQFKGVAGGGGGDVGEEGLVEVYAGTRERHQYGRYNTQTNTILTSVHLTSFLTSGNRLIEYKISFGLAYWMVARLYTRYEAKSDAFSR